MQRLQYLLIYLPLLLNAQVNTFYHGIHFEKDITWDQVKIRAKTENKYIFAVCYTKYCASCKEMSNEVYQNESVGKFINSKFISVKIQMDTLQQDGGENKLLYSFFQGIRRQYKLTILPTYIFFSPEGKIIHKDFEAGDVNGFLSIVNDALKPEKQYYTLLENYKSGIKDYTIMPYLARTARRFKENELSFEVAQDYINNYLFRLKSNEFFTEENIEFIKSFIQSSESKSFHLFYCNANKIDEVMKDKGYSKQCIDYIIYKEEIAPIFNAVEKAGGNPDWKNIFKNIEIKYSGVDAYRNVLNAKVRWYRYKNEWKLYAKNLVKQVQKYGVGNTLAELYLNNYAWEVFQYSNCRRELKKALLWSERGIQINSRNDANLLDTKANILYKLGRKKQAILLEEKVISIDHPKRKDFLDNLAKMKIGDPTWREDYGK